MSNVDIESYISSLNPSSVACTFNGVKLDKEITGYRTDSVEGREPLDAEISEDNYVSRSGSRFIRNREITRDITVSFSILTDTKGAYIHAFDRLKGYLSPYDSNEYELVFDDEPDKYYKGSVKSVAIDEVIDATPGYACHGKFIIHCTDPCKYSFDVHSVEQVLDHNTARFQFNVDYDGSEPAPFKVEGRMIRDQDYIVLMNQRGSIISAGSTDHSNQDWYKSSETLISIPHDSKKDLQNFLTTSINYVGEGYVGIDNAGNDNYGIVYVNGSNAFNVSMKHLNGNDLPVIGYNLNSTYKNWGGTTGVYTLPADGDGVTTGAKWWEFHFAVAIGAHSPTEKGIFMCTALDKDNYPIAATVFMKAGTSDAVWVDRWIGKNKVYSNEIKGAANGSANNNEWFIPQYKGDDAFGSCCIRRFGGTDDKNPKFEFREGSTKKFFDDYYDAPSWVVNKRVTKLAFTFCELGDFDQVYAMGLRGLGFRKDFGPSPFLVKNKFAVHDKVCINTDDASISVNGISKPYMGSLGNDWEEMKLYPGTNQIMIQMQQASKEVTNSKTPMYLKYRTIYK